MVLSGHAIEQESAKSVLSRKRALGNKKRSGVEIADSLLYDSYKTPEVFKQSVLEILSAMTDGLSTEEARQLASDPISSPVIQMFIELEDGFMRKDMLGIIFPSMSGEPDFLTISYLENLLTSPVGSHFLENVISNCPISFVDYICFSFIVPRLDIISKAQGFSYAVKAIMGRLNRTNAAEFGKILLARVSDLTCKTARSIMIFLSNTKGASSN